MRHECDFRPLTIEPRGGMPMLIKACKCGDRLAISLRQFRARVAATRVPLVPVPATGTSQADGASVPPKADALSASSLRVARVRSDTGRHEPRGVVVPFRKAGA